VFTSTVTNLNLKTRKDKKEGACESGRYVCDNRRKVPTVGHLGVGKVTL